MKMFLYVGTYENLDFAKEALAENPGAIIVPSPNGFMVMRPAPENEPPKPAPAPAAKAQMPSPEPKRKPSTITRGKPAT